MIIVNIIEFRLYKKLWKMKSRNFIIKLFYTMKLFCQPTSKLSYFVLKGTCDKIMI